MSAQCTCGTNKPDCTAHSSVCKSGVPPTGPVFPVTTRRVDDKSKK